MIGFGHGAGADVVRVVTRVDKRRGRGGDLSPSPVKAAALELGWRVVKHVGSNAIVVGGSDRILGIGAGERENVEPYGLSFERPVARLEDALAKFEAVPEKMGIKQAVIKEMEGACPEQTIFASNTSSAPGRPPPSP